MKKKKSLLFMQSVLDSTGEGSGNRRMNNTIEFHEVDFVSNWLVLCNKENAMPVWADLINCSRFMV